MRTSSEYRADARAKLSGKWGKAALISLGYFVTFFVLSFVEGLLSFSEALKVIFSIALLLVEVPLAFGLVISYYKLFNGEDVKAFDFLQSGFSSFKRSWLVGLNILLKMILPIIVTVVGMILFSSGIAVAGVGLLAGSSSLGGSVVLAIIGGIIYLVGIIWSVLKSYYYQLAYVVAVDNEELSNKEVVEKCKEIMQGKRWKLFCLQFSFIGWSILAALTFGIGMLWLIPYIQLSSISFYQDAMGKNTAE